MKILNFVMLSVFLVQFSGPAQELYIPKEIRKTYINGTRDLSGNPGSKFWQNKPEYKIEASIDSYRRTIAGKEVIRYSNNSPDTLRTIVIRLYQDFHKPGKSRDWETDEKHLNEGVKLHGITLNGYEIALNEKNVSRPGTRVRIISGVSINPGETAEIGIEWSFSLSEENSRMGVYDSTSYMIAYWYPQISVYDDIDGWDESDYNGLVEFYNEFADFDVRIKTDRPGLCVWSTGELRNPQDVFSEEFLKEYISVKNGNSKLKADLSDAETRNRIFKNNGSAVWNYTARNVPDFAFAMSDHYVWEMKKVETSKGRSAVLNTAFRPNATALNKHNVFDVAEKYLKYASAEFPGVPYPYPSMSVFNGDGGMEFPMMVNDDDTQTWNSTVYLTSHEMSHTYFPFYTGTNETRYGWMDEGWAVYLPQDFQTMMQKFIPDDEKNSGFRTDSRE
ncbi:MAG: hypothetical protein L0Y76_10390, partial [Ignavibacteria bacterium]|nr:hypothetical protein [Ignavibacteria bacterium]